MNSFEALKAGYIAVFESIEEDHGSSYVTYRSAGTKLYHGSDDIIKSLSATPTWFGEDTEIASTYGDVVNEYEIGRSIKLFNFKENPDNIARSAAGYGISGTDREFMKMLISLNKPVSQLKQLKEYIKAFKRYGTMKHGLISHIEHPEIIKRLIDDGFDGIALNDEPAYGSRGHWYPTVFLFDPTWLTYIGSER